MEKYEKKYAELDQGTALTREVPPPYTRRPPPVPTAPTPPSYVFVKEEAPRRKLYPVLSNPQVAIMSYGSATDQQKQQWEDRAKEEADQRAFEEDRKIREAQTIADTLRELGELQRDLEEIEESRRIQEQHREIRLKCEQMSELKQNLDEQAREMSNLRKKLRRDEEEILAL